MKEVRLPIMEMFYSIQGEGYQQGKSAFFVRLAGCDVGCSWCDVKDSWDKNKYPLYSIQSILQEIKKTNTQNIVITGGEPLMHNLNDLCGQLKQQKLNLFLETSGAYPMSGNWDWICISPKKFKPPLEENLIFANELKVIVYNKDDLKWATNYAQKVNTNCKLFLQPEWSKKEAVSPFIIDFIKDNPTWMLSVQIHKYLQIE
ncbi:MAG: 7-carboxy-7-deazaguanine synthase QueE [Sediminibacterium sp.]|nr:7-carboxy-7-deazaguanine synthase QueE [Sediminibacterium sp.]